MYCFKYNRSINSVINELQWQDVSNIMKIKTNKPHRYYGVLLSLRVHTQYIELITL